jgi:hypothetical protein
MQALLRRQLSQDMQFPPLFAIIASDDSRGRATIYQSTLVRDGPDRWGESPSIYHIAPYRIFHGARDVQYAAEAFLLTGQRRIGLPRHDVMLVADLSAATAATAEPDPLPVRQLIYHGRWEQTGQTVLSMFCASPIPVLELPTTGARRIRWPPPAYNRLPLIPTDHDFVQLWQRRWVPADADTAGAGAAAGGRGTPSSRLIPVLEPLPPVVSLRSPPPTATATAGPSAIASELPSFVANAIVADAIARGLQCPITLEPIAEITRPVAVTNCYHVFESTAFHTWLHTGDGTCPVCKARI